MIKQTKENIKKRKIFFEKTIDRPFLSFLKIHQYLSLYHNTTTTAPKYKKLLVI